MEIAFASFSQVGPRDVNQDRVLAPANSFAPYFVAAIADGIGGAPGGAEAASLAIEMVEQLAPFTAGMPALFERIVLGLREQADANPLFSRMGTTLSVALLQEGTVTVGHVGDTRIYHLRAGGLNSLTHDQTEIAELVRKGIISSRQAKRYPRRNVLLSALSPKGQFEVQESTAILKPGDRLLMLTDGVHQRVARGAILNASISNAEVGGFVDELERLTVLGEPSDNYSALAVEIIANGAD